MGSTSPVSILPSPSRLKSDTSELSPVLTTPPPVLPKTVLVRISVPAPMLSSNLVVTPRRRRASAHATKPRTITAVLPTSTYVLLSKSSRNDGSCWGCGGRSGGLGLGGSALAAAASASASLVSLFDGAVFEGSAAARVGALAASALASSPAEVTVAGAGGGVAAAGAAGVGKIVCVGAAGTRHGN